MQMPSPGHWPRHSAGLAVWCGALLVGFLLIWLLGQTVAPFLLGALIAFLTRPLASWLEARGWPPWLSATAGTAVALAAFVATAGLVLPLLVAEFVQLVKDIPDIAEDLASFAGEVSRRWFGRSFESMASPESMNALLAPIQSVAEMATGSLLTTIDLLLMVVLTPFVTFFLLRDGSRGLNHLSRLVPARLAPDVMGMGREIREQLSAFLRGQALVCLAQAIWHTTGLLLIGLDFAVIIGLLTGLSALVPVIGNLVMLSVALITAAVQFSSLVDVLLVALVYATGQLSETAVLAPHLIGQRIKLHPLWVLFALLAAGSLFGLAGALLALPGAAVIQVLVRSMLETYREETLTDPEDPAPPD